MNTPGIENLREFFISFYSRLPFIRRIFMFMTVLTVLVTVFLSNTYTLTGEIIVLSTELLQKGGDALTEGTSTQYLPVTLKDIETETTILRSLPLIRDAVSHLHDEGKLPLEYSVLDIWIKQPLNKHIIEPVLSVIGDEEVQEEDDTITELTKLILDSLEILPLPGSNVITINFETKDVESGRTFVNRLMDNYLTKRTTLMAGTSNEELFLQKKQLYKERLNQLAEAKIELFGQHEIHNPKEELSLILQTINTEQLDFNQLSDKLLEAEKWLQYLKKNIRNLIASQPTDISIPYSSNRGDSSTTQISPDSEMKQQLELIGNLQTQYDTALLSFNSDSLQVTQVLDKLTLAKNRLAALFDNRMTEHMQKIGVFQAVIDQKHSRLKLLKERASLLNEMCVREMEIDTEFNAINGALFQYSRQYEEKHSENLLKQEKWRNVRVLNYAPVPLEPSSPKKIVVFLVGILSSIITAVSLGFLLEIVDQRFHDHIQLANRLDLPVIAIIDDQDFEKSGRFSLSPARFRK